MPGKGVGHQLLPEARRVLAEADRFTTYVRNRHGRLRLGYAWAALGRHTTPLQRQWARHHDDIDLEVVRHNTATSGLAEGLCEVAVVRSPVDERRFDSVVVGLEQRVVAFAVDDPEWARRRRLRLAEIATRTVIVDLRSGTTTQDLWRGSEQVPHFIESSDVVGWLDLIAAGRGVGITASATADHHPGPGVVYRPVTDGPRIPVRLAWWRDARPRGLDDLVDAVTARCAAG